MSEKHLEKILLVGNGPSVERYELGDVIDSYDYVVRFNWYHIKGFEKNVGTKTDVWFTTVADPVRAKKEYDYIIEHTWQWDYKADKTFQKLLPMLSGKFQEERRFKKTFPMICDDMNNWMKKKEGVVKNLTERNNTFWSVWSTGAMAAWTFLQSYHHPYWGSDPEEMRLPSCDQVHLFGFDWWDMDSESYHHYGDSQQVGANHNPQKEFLFFTRLWEEGAIHDLNPESEFHNAPRSND